MINVFFLLFLEKVPKSRENHKGSLLITMVHSFMSPSKKCPSKLQIVLLHKQHSRANSTKLLSQWLNLIESSTFTKTSYILQKVDQDMFTAIFDLYQMQHDFVACYCSYNNVHVRDVGSVYLKIIILSVRFICDFHESFSAFYALVLVDNALVIILLSGSQNGMITS